MENTEKRWDEFEKNESQFRKSESVQQDIQQILDTVTQIKTDVDQLKEEGPKATGIADEQPTLSAPSDNQPPTEESAPEGEPQTPMGDLMAQPEDGAATPMPEEQPPAPAPEAPPMAPPMEEEMPPFDLNQYPSGMKQESDEDIILDAVKDVKNPELKKQLLALAYQSLEEQTAVPPMAPPVPDMNGDGALTPEDAMIADAAVGGAPEGDIPPEALLEALATDAVYRSNSQNPAAGILSEAKSDDESEDKKDDDDKKEESEDKDDEKKDGEGKKEPFEPGVTGMPESKDEDNDSTEEIPVVTEVTIENEEPAGEDEEKTEAIESIVDTVLENAKEKITEQVVEAIDGIEDTSGFTLSTSTGDMMKARYGKKLGKTITTNNSFRRSIQWPEDVKSIPMEDKCRLFAKSWNSMDNESQDAVIGLMDRTVGPERTDAIFKSEGVDLDKIYKYSKNQGVDTGSAEAILYGTTPEEREYDSEKKPIKKKTKPVQESDDMPDTAIDNSTAVASSETAPIEECNDSTMKTADTESFQDCDVKKSADVGIHIPTVNEMLAFKKSGRSVYTPMPREMAEPHGLVKMDDGAMDIPSTRELLNKRFAKQ